MPTLKSLLALLALASTSVLAVPAAAPYPAPASSELPELADGVIATSSSAEGPDVVSNAAAGYADGTYKKTVLKHHNVHRANHSAPNVAWGNNMANWAQTVAESCIWRHNISVGTKPYGQNIAAGSPPTQISNVITLEFYNGEVNYFPASSYGLANPDMSDFEHWGHFSQVVWKGTKNVGCYTQDCTKQGGIKGLEGMNIPPYFTVCNYYPPGNMGGEYGANVLKSKGQPSVYANY